MRFRNISILLIVVAVVSFFVYDNYLSPASIEQRIIQRKNYDVQILADDVSVKFAFQPEWLQLELNKPRKLMQKISQVGDSEILIEEVVRQEERICVSLLVKPKYNFRKGDFLFVDKINPDGTFGSVNGQWSVLRSGKALDPLKESFGFGSGPGNRIGIFLDIDRARQLDKTVEIMYRGLQKYAYQRVLVLSMSSALTAGGISKSNLISTIQCFLHQHFHNSYIIVFSEITCWVFLI